MGSNILDATATRSLDDVLAQHGVKGMKWGQRKARKSGGSSGGDSSSSPKPMPRRLAKKAPKPTKKMSDQELNKVIKRIELEKRYAQLTAPQPSATKKFISETMLTVGKQQAATYGNKAAAKLIETMIKQAGKAAVKAAT